MKKTKQGEGKKTHDHRKIQVAQSVALSVNTLKVPMINLITDYSTYGR